MAIRRGGETAEVVALTFDAVAVEQGKDVALAVKGAGAAKFRNAGQVCISPTRFLVHNSIKQACAEAMVKHAESLKLGDGIADQIVERHLFVGDAVDEGRIGAVLEQPADEVGEQLLVAADRRIDAAGTVELALGERPVRAQPTRIARVASSRPTPCT